VSASLVPLFPEFAPGERARANGVYRVLHDSHRDTHSVTIMKGDEFPVCKKCGDRVRYQLWLESEYFTKGWEENVSRLGVIEGGRGKAAFERRTQFSDEAGTQTAPVHSVHIYSDDSALVSRLCGIVSSGLKIGDAVLIVAKAAHRMQLVEQLRTAGVNVREHARQGRFVMVDASEALSTFMINGMPDAELFAGAIGKLLEDARSRSQSKRAGLTVFGEMVAVLWDEGNKQGAIALEELWNAALNQRAFHLHCAYPRSGFMHPEDEGMVCQTHSHVLRQ
jgi:hypothetical protein